MLTAENIRFRYRSATPLLEGVSCRVAPGEVVGLPGASGCGKSSFARILAGFIKPEGGRIAIDDRPIPTIGRCPVQMIFQHPEQAVNPRWQIHRILAEGHDAFHPLLPAFGLGANLLDRYPHELSGGELQRITLIRAMSQSTRYLIADEISASLDTATQALIWHGLLDWADQNQVGILAISHDLPLLRRICSRIDESFLAAA